MIKNIILLVITTIITITATEYLLYYFFPISVTNTGYTNRPNGLKYGWGFYPHELVRTEDPDTFEVHYDRVNKDGWRDRDRDFANDDGAFRILALGDSMTFGYLVTKEQTYTAILENKLRAAGINAEVINIAYSGWGTDQSYEALRLEGQKYKPDLVIYHFVSNDLSDNTLYLDKGKFAARKPFYYEVDGENLVRKKSEPFEEKLHSWSRKRVISKSEILKRLWLITESMKQRGAAPYFYSDRANDRIKYFLKLPADHVLFAKLQALPQKLQKSDFEAVVEQSNLNPDQKEKLSIILTAAGANDAYLVDGNWEKEDFSHYRWTLARQLIFALSDLSKRIGAKFALISDQEEGLYNWDRAWLRVADGEKPREHYFELNRFLDDTMSATDGERIPSPVPHQRAKNDSHINAAGNEAVAENIYRYLKTVFPQLNIP